MVKFPKLKNPKVDATEKSLSWLYVFGGFLGFVAAFILTIEKIEIIKDPTFQPSCNINPILSCGSVMTTPQAEAFGFPNSLIGIAGFAVVTAIGLALLAGARFKQWYWWVIQGGLTFAVVFVHWLMYQTIFNINALCPYCMVVWTVTIPLFWYTTLRNLKQLKIKNKTAKALAEFSQKHHGDILLAWYVAIVAVIIYHFWYYWQTLI